MVQERNAGAYSTPKKKKTPRSPQRNAYRSATPSTQTTRINLWDSITKPQPIPDGIRHPYWEESMRDDYYNARNNALDDWRMDTTQPPGPTPPGPGPGGDGGGGRSASAIAGMQSTALQQLLNSRAFTAGGIEGDLGRVNSAVNADKAAADGAYGDLAAYLGQMQDPYANMELARTPGVDPSLLALLGANGADTNSYMGQVELANTQAAQGDSAADRLRQMMSGVAQESQKSRLGEAESARTYAGRELEGQRSTLTAALEARQREEQKALDSQKMQVVMQLIAAMAESGQAVDVGQFFGGK